MIASDIANSIKPEFYYTVRGGVAMIRVRKKYFNCAKKFTRLLFDFGVISQVLSTSGTMMVNNRLRRRALLTTAVV